MVDPRRRKNEPNRDIPWLKNRLARRVKTTGTAQVAGVETTAFIVKSELYVASIVSEGVSAASFRF